MFRHAIFCFILSFVTFNASAQQRYYFYVPYENMSERQQLSAQRGYIGFSYPSMSINATGHYRDPGSYGANVFDTSFSINKRTSFGIGVVWGGFLRLADYRNGGQLALDIALSAEYCSLKLDEIPGTTFGSDGSISKYALPICLMYKHGAEAELDRSKKFMYSVGIGIQPARLSFKYYSVNTDMWKFRPYLLAECGVFAGIAMKLRATYYPLSTVLHNTSGTADKTLYANVTGSSETVVSLLFMLRSYHWN
jgi:hypothetical protein